MPHTCKYIHYILTYIIYFIIYTIYIHTYVSYIYYTHIHMRWYVRQVVSQKMSEVMIISNKVKFKD